jgi:hypothetical protein
VTVLTDQERSWVDDLSRRLRLIEADAAQANPEKRREFLQEEVVRSFKNVARSDRKRLLEGLLRRFPVAGQVATLAAQPAPAPAVAPAAPPESPQEILERLIAAASKLSEERRSELAKRLAEAGLAWMDRDAVIMEIFAELRRKLPIQADQQPRLRGLADLSLLLIDLLYRLDQLALTTLRELSPKNPLLKRPQDFRNAVGRFLVNENEPLEPQLKMMSSLLGALLAAVLSGGRDFGRQYVERFSPANIEDVVVGEGKGGVLKSMYGPSEKERCWEKYNQLSNDFATPDLIDRKIKDCMAKIVESSVLGKR